MLCPICGRPTRVVRTEQVSAGMTRTTRLCTVPTTHAHPGVEFETFEVLAGAARAVGVSRLQAAVEKLQRGRERRDLAAERKAHVKRLLARGMSTRATARKVGIAQARVRAIRDEATH
jgi:hypothetical protein